MNSIGKTIKRLRLARGDTQENIANALNISCQAVSKWENENAAPDISILPLLADYFGVTIDELMNHSLNVYTKKDRFVKLLHDSGALVFTDNGYYLNTEKISTNAQFAKIGELFADYIQENRLIFDAVAGISYHGIGFSAATAFSLYQKYGVTTSYFFDRKTPDIRSRMVCGYTPKRGDRIIVIDDGIGTGGTLDRHLEYLCCEFGVKIAAVLAIINLENKNADGIFGEEHICNKYNTTVHTLVSDDDIKSVFP